MAVSPAVRYETIRRTGGIVHTVDATGARYAPLVSCDWPVDRTCLTPLPAEGEDGYDEALAKRNRAEDAAVLILWRLTGGRFGICPTTARPCPPDGQESGYRGGGGSGWPSNFPVVLWDGGNWVNTACGCATQCRRSGPGMVHLPGPASNVRLVVLGNEVLAPDQYALEGNVLYRRGDAVRWPGQNLSRPIGEPGTWWVDYDRGEAVPAGGDMAAGALAKEINASCEGTACRLPKTVVSLTRQGVTHQFDPTKILAAGFTGLPEVDQWVQSVNPHRLMAAPVVL